VTALNSPKKKKQVVIAVLTSLGILGVVGSLLQEVLTPTGSYVGNLLRNLIFPSTPPDTEILNVTDGNNTKVSSGGSTSSNAIMIKFAGKDNVGIKSYECSLDGGPFSFCKSPYRFSTDAGIHFFSVRGVDNEETPDPTPADYNLTVLTSATVEGVVKRTDKTVPNVIVVADKKYKDTTVEGGTFILLKVPNGYHTYEILNKSFPLYRDKFYIREEDSLKDLGVIDIATAAIHTSAEPSFGSNVYSTVNQSGNPILDALKNIYGGITGPEAKKSDNMTHPVGAISPRLPGINDAYIAQSNVSPRLDVTLNYNESLTLSHGSKYHDIRAWIEGTPELISEIDRVTYYLHPTFKPDVITKYSPENRFELMFSAWGQFDLKAKVYFKNGETQDVSKKIVF
jgi:pYEATS domain-containing protein involved in immunity